jgi:hypothetical protein
MVYFFKTHLPKAGRSIRFASSPVRASSPLGQNLNRTYWSRAFRNLFWTFWWCLSCTALKLLFKLRERNSDPHRKLDCFFCCIWGLRHLEYEVGCVASGRRTTKIIEKSGEWRVKMLESFATHICICSPAVRTYYEKKSDLAGPRLSK